MTNNERMRVIEMNGSGPPQVLQPGLRERPKPGPQDVLVRVAYAGVNGPDLIQRRGLYPPPHGASDLLGLEVAGEVVSVGAQVGRWKAGDLICGLAPGGGYAQYCTLPAEHCLPIPQGLGVAEAASLPEAYFTIWSNIFMGAGLRASDVFLVHGGAGGLGTAAIQLGKAFGARVVATDHPAQRLAVCEALGADRSIDYEREDFVEVVRAEFGGADVILDIVGGPYVQRNFKAARHDARIVQLAFALGARVELDLMPLMLKRLQLSGSTLRTRSNAFKAEVARQLEDRVWPLLASGQLQPVVHRTLALADAATAHAQMESAGHLGKIVLKV